MGHPFLENSGDPLKNDTYDITPAVVKTANTKQ